MVILRLIGTVLMLVLLVGSVQAATLNEKTDVTREMLAPLQDPSHPDYDAATRKMRENAYGKYPIDEILQLVETGDIDGLTDFITNNAAVQAAYKDAPGVIDALDDFFGSTNWRADIALDADAVPVADAGGHYAGTNVESILAELPNKFSLVNHGHAGVYELILGNPEADGHCLRSTIAGVRSWGECGSGTGTVDISGAVNPDEIATWSDGDTLKALTEVEFKTAYNMEAGVDYAAPLGADDNYVTGAEKTVIGLTSGENTGDQDLSPYLLQSALTYSLVVGKWTSCTGGYLKFDGTCDTPTGGGDLLAENNLSELTDLAAARGYLGLANTATMPVGNTDSTIPYVFECGTCSDTQYEDKLACTDNSGTWTPTTGICTNVIASTIAVVASDDDCAGQEDELWYDVADGAFEYCEADSGTPTTISGGGLAAVLAGNGISVSGGDTVSILPTYTQRRVSASCSAGSSIRAIAEDGTVTCETDDTAAGAGYVATPPTYSDEACTAGQYALSTTTGYVCVSSGDWNTFSLTNWNNPTPSIPTLSSATIPEAGTTISLVHSESVTATISAGFDLDCTTAGNDITMTYDSGSPSTTLVYTLGATVNSGDTCNLDYTQPGDGIEATTGGGDLASITDGTVTNDSIQSTSDGFVGNSAASTSSGNSSSSNESQYQLFEATTSGTISYCHAEVADIDGASVNIAIYSSDVSAKLADGTLTNVVGSPAVVDVTLDNPITVASGASYFLNIGAPVDAFWRVNYTAGTGIVYYYDVPTTVGDSMPDPMSTGGTLKTNSSLRIWCDNTPSGS